MQLIPRSLFVEIFVLDAASFMLQENLNITRSREYKFSPLKTAFENKKAIAYRKTIRKGFYLPSV